MVIIPRVLLSDLLLVALLSLERAPNSLRPRGKSIVCAAAAAQMSTSKTSSDDMVFVVALNRHLGVSESSLIMFTVSK